MNDTQLLKIVKVCLKPVVDNVWHVWSCGHVCSGVQSITLGYCNTSVEEWHIAQLIAQPHGSFRLER